MFQDEKMTSRKAKELQAVSNSNSLEEIKDLLNAKFSEQKNLIVQQKISISS